MSIEQIIQNGHFTLTDAWYVFLQSYPLLAKETLIVSAILLLILIAQGISCLRQYTGIWSRFLVVGTTLLSCFFVGFVTYCTIFYFIDRDRTNVLYMNWLKSDVVSYIDSLPYQTYPVVEALHISEDGTEDVGIQDFLTKMPTASLQAVLLSYKIKNTTERLSSYVIIRYDVPKNKEDYVELKFLSKSIGHGIDRGYYNPILHLHKGEVLTEFDSVYPTTPTDGNVILYSQISNTKF